MKDRIFVYTDEIDYSLGSIVSKVILKNSGGNVTLFAFDEGQSLSEHTAPYDAIVNVVDGEAEIIIDKKSYIVKDGQTIIMPANITHSVVAHRKFKMVLTMLK